MKTYWICACLVPGLIAGEVRADRLAELEAQVEALASQIAALKQEQAKLQAATAPPAVEPPRKVVTSGVMSGSILLPDSDTSVKIGGFVRASLMSDFQGSLGNSQTVLLPYSPRYGGIPYDGTVYAKRKGQVQFEARESRLNIETRTPTEHGELRTLIEGDFYGAGGSKATTNSVSLRLRHAMAELGPWMVGQYWSNFADLGQGPEVFDFGGPVGLPALNRQTQIRYTHELNPKLKLSASIEQPVQDFIGADTVLFSAGINNISSNSIDKSPELTTRLTLADDWGRQSVGAALRRLDADDGDEVDDQLTGYAFNYQGQLAVGKKDKLYYDLVYERGAGRYLTHTPPSAALHEGRLYAISGQGMNISYQHWWSESFRSNLSAGLIRLDNPHPATPLTQFDGVRSLHANLLWSPVPKALLGLEYTYAEIRNEAHQRGSGQRLNVVTQFGF
ncbi:Porin subfamily protein [compost metagenome]